MAGKGKYYLERLNPSCGFFAYGTPVETRSTGLQQLEVFDSPQFGRVMRLDGVFMTSEGDEFFYHEPMIHVAATAHPEPRRALVIGGGDGGSAEELLKHPSIEQVIIAEIDAEVVAAARAHFGALHRGALDDPRVRLFIGDGRRFVEEENGAFDLMVLDLTDPFGPAQALYTREFFAACARRLGESGILSVHIGSPVYRPATVARLYCTLHGVFPFTRAFLAYVPLYGSLWAMAVASRTLDCQAIPEDEIARRIAERGIGELRVYSPRTHGAMFALPPFVEELLSRDVPPLGEGLPPLEDPIDLNTGGELRIVESD